VEITGEAFFDIAKNPSRPFHVKAKDMEVDILGTQFNINSYPDEPDTRTTLLEGSVSVAAGTAAPSREPVRGQLLEPGQQARAQGGKISLVSNPDINQAVAWKSGLFDFNHVNLQAVVRQLARWYDIDVKFEGNVSDRYFRGKVTRDLKLSQVIQLLQDVNVKFHIDGKTLIVTP
jgi:ferric-dicitrate binding protein FerR (iron transport regulator)